MNKQPLYLSATDKDAGKTALAVGLLGALHSAGHDIGYMKPIGQQYVSINGHEVDKDVVLTLKPFGFDDDVTDMNPITVPSGFTKQYIAAPHPEVLEQKIIGAFGRLNAAHERMILEGTGHAGVGSCFDLSNARVAELVGASVVIITGGGIGKAIDEAMLSLNLFEKHGAHVVGVILNKVWPEKIDSIRNVVEKGLEHLGTRLLGILPYLPELGYPRMEEVVKKIKGRVLCGETALDNRVDHTVIAAMRSASTLSYIRKNTLVIAAGDRLDSMRLALKTPDEADENAGSISGLILTGGFDLPDDIHDLAETSGIPVIQCDSDTYTVASAAQKAKYKVQPDDIEKIALTRKLIADHFDVQPLLDAMDITG